MHVRVLQNSIMQKKCCVMVQKISVMELKCSVMELNFKSGYELILVKLLPPTF